MKLTFIGLGRMGYPMVERLLNANVEVTIFNRTKDRAIALIQKGARWADSPRQAVLSCDVLATMVSDDSALENLLGPGEIMEALPSGSIHLSFSTISIDYARSLEKRHQDRSHGFVSSPVFGRPEAVREGRLRLLCAGEESNVKKVTPVLNAIGARVFFLGKTPSAANLVKLSGNFLIAAALESLGESFALVKKAGVDPLQFLEIINDSLFHSPLYENYGTIMGKETFDPPGFTMKLGLKDIKLVLDAAEILQVPLPVGSIVRDNFLEGLAHGRESLDWSSIVLSNFERAGIKKISD